ncbi:MAG: succinate dehydrogenase assembly factor 2 [Colwellia sp.]|nr:succinate dehydrogenase assembly factor 2 [Colwellia sp.]
MSTEVNSQHVDSQSIDSQPIVNKARLKWACRRGMLELDVLFIPFVEEAYDDLTAKQQRTFERLLTEQDPDLFAWFLGHKTCEDNELNAMVQFILNRVKV